METAAVQREHFAEPAEDEIREPPGFAALRDLLADPRPFADEPSRRRGGRVARRMIYSADFEKATLDPRLPPTYRLRALAELQRLANASDLRPRDRDEAMSELDRAGMRVLWGARVVETVLETEAPPEKPRRRAAVADRRRRAADRGVRQVSSGAGEGAVANGGGARSAKGRTTITRSDLGFAGRGDAETACG